MANSVVFTRAADGSNYTMNVGTSHAFSFQRTSGTLPPESATIRRVSVSFSNIVVYTYRNPEISFGSLGTFSLSQAEDGGSQSGTLSGVNDSAVKAFQGGSLTLTANADREVGKTCASIRSTCAITITVEYDVTTKSTGTLNKSSVVQGQNITMTINPADSAFSHRITWKNTKRQKATFIASLQSSNGCLWPQSQMTCCLDPKMTCQKCFESRIKWTHPEKKVKK